jgi:hypothetical protein
MIRMLLVLLLVCALPSAASAQLDTSSNGIGIYFDSAGYSFCSQAAPYTMATAYLLATRISDPAGISAWECAVYTNPATLPAGLTVQIPGCLDCEAGFPNLHVAPPAPLPQGSAITLATLSTFYLGGPVYFYVGATTPTSYPTDAGPCYAGAGDPSLWRRLRPFIGGFAPDPLHADSWLVAAINDYQLCRVTTAEPTTWGTVKGLYR